MTVSSPRPARKRAASIQHAIHNIEIDPCHHLTGSFLPQTPLGSDTYLPNGFKKYDDYKKHVQHSPRVANDFYESKGLWVDIKTSRWMRVPSSSFKLMIVPILAYLNWELLNMHNTNPFEPLLHISYRLSETNSDDPRYAKGWLDLFFIAYHVVVFSFIRQFTILKVVHPIARRLGIKKQAKLDRFGEQAYALLYYGVMGAWGTYIMSTLPTWWYRTEHYWLGYPHWDMTPHLKRYYLMHLSYWLQQLIILGMKLEKPRKDFNELVAHHIVTIWLIGWSYGTNMTLIGNAVFVSMDIPDTFLAFSKLCNYLQFERTKAVAFVIFTGVWTYFRHWLNLVILWSVWTEFDLIPDAGKNFRPAEGVWMVSWMKYQVFIPILLLQLLNLFWYFLIWRILIRAVVGNELGDERSDDEDD